MVCIDNRVDINIAATREQIEAYKLNDEKVYYSQKDNVLHAPQDTTNRKISRYRRNGTMPRDFTVCPREDSNFRHRL